MKYQIVFGKEELELLIQWYHATQDCCHKDYLKKNDKLLYKKIKNIISTK